MTDQVRQDKLSVNTKVYSNSRQACYDAKDLYFSCSSNFPNTPERCREYYDQFVANCPKSWVMPKTSCEIHPNFAPLLTQFGHQVRHFEDQRAYAAGTRSSRAP